jgi:hypothetical protein
MPYFNTQSATVLRRVNKPPLLGPYATQHQINQVVFKDNKYRRYEVEVQDDEDNAAAQPVTVILLRSLEGVLWGSPVLGTKLCPGTCKARL